VLGQTYREVELHLVDDGSTDGTEEVVRRWADDPRFHYIRQAHAGQAAARNLGVRQSRGEYLAFLDADDCWHPAKLAKQIERFADPAVGVVYSRARYIDARGTEIDFRPSGDYLRPRRGAVMHWLVFDNFVPFSSSLVRRRCVEQVGGLDESLAMADDWDLWLRLSVDNRFDYVDEPLLYYRMGHTGQLSQRMELRLQCCDRIFDRFLRANAGRIPERTVRRARAYICANRGRYFEDVDRWRALRYYSRSIRHEPVQLPAYKGLVRCVLPRSFVA
jgi:glycosyltransferase involved in cell wall biosynthesis